MVAISFKKVLRNFIVLEGLDGCGTTTQTALLIKKLEEKGIVSVSTREPTDGNIGLFIRSVLQKKQSVDPFTLAMLFSADRNEHVNGTDGIKKACDAGKMVICDRYLFSSLAYQSMFMDYDIVAQLNSFYPLPEHLFYIDLSPEECQKRMQIRGEESELFERLDLQKKTEANYRKTLESLKDSDMKIHIIDGRLSIEKIHEYICEVLKL